MRTTSALCLCALLVAAALSVGCTQAATGSASASGSSSENGGAASTQSEASSQVVDADYVANLESDVYLVDTRTPEEYAAGHIPGALNASYPKSTGGPCQAEENASSFLAAWSKLDVPVDAPVVLYCRTGVRASAAASALEKNGYTNVKVYEGSWTDWTSDSSRPTE